jgi:RNA polymerase-binding transcription factor DksA
MTTISEELTPLERLRLRDLLQDSWRDEVRRITELSLELHTALDPAADCDVVPESVAAALSEARLRLGEIERAMSRLDDRSYGRCAACFGTIPYCALVDDPAGRYCDECRSAAARDAVAMPARAG